MNNKSLKNKICLKMLIAVINTLWRSASERRWRACSCSGWPSLWWKWDQVNHQEDQHCWMQEEEQVSQYQDSPLQDEWQTHKLWNRKNEVITRYTHVNSRDCVDCLKLIFCYTLRPWDSWYDLDQILAWGCICSFRKPRNMGEKHSYLLWTELFSKVRICSH